MYDVIYNERAELTFRQRWASYLVIVITVLGLGFGLVQRNNVINASQFFESSEFGIASRFPATWIRQEGRANVIFRAFDPAAIPFKTALQIEVIAVGVDANPEDVLNDLNINRAVQLSTYRQLTRNPTILPNGSTGTEMIYSYAAVEVNPFLQAEPITVRAIDVVVLRGSQAIVITFESDAVTFDEKRQFFDNFLRFLAF